MRYFPSITAGTPTLRRGRGSSVASAAKALLVLVLEALHDSRRREAERTLRRYRHLIDPAGTSLPGGQNQASGTPIARDDTVHGRRPSPRASAVRSSAPMAMTLIIFLSLNSLAGVILQWAGPADRIAPKAQELVALLLPHD